MMTFPNRNETYICVDVEASGPIPPDYSLLSIGACKVFEPTQTFYIELKPINENTTEEAAAIHRLSVEHLLMEGVPPEEAMTRFEEWLKAQTPPGKLPLCVAFNAPFDWMFINYYFHHYLGHNPFGHSAIDIKALYMGMTGSQWFETSWRYINPEFKSDHGEQTGHVLTHHALQDALDQAYLFKKIIEESHKR
jgi:DNA polymerase III epsilon subunit-like protein